MTHRPFSRAKVLVLHLTYNTSHQYHFVIVVKQILNALLSQEPEKKKTGPITSWIGRVIV